MEKNSSNWPSEAGFGGIAIVICMPKVRNIAEIAPTLVFSEFDFYDLYRSTFEKSELCRIKRLLPLREMAEDFGLVIRSMGPKLGRKSFYTSESKVSLLFLKMYTGLSCPQTAMGRYSRRYAG